MSGISAYDDIIVQLNDLKKQRGSQLLDFYAGLARHNMSASDWQALAVMAITLAILTARITELENTLSNWTSKDY